MKIQPSNTGVGNLNRSVDVVSYEENPSFPEDSFYYVDQDKIKKELKFKYVDDLFSSPQEFNDALYDYIDLIHHDGDPDDFINITLKELIEDFRNYIKYDT